METLGIPILNENTLPLHQGSYHNPHIILSTETCPNPWRYEVLKADFTLHDNFMETIEFVKQMNPELAIVVHSPPDKTQDITIEQYLLRDPQCHTQFIFPEANEIYTL